jgi:hypothetical protein
MLPRLVTGIALLYFYLPHKQISLPEKQQTRKWILDASGRQVMSITGNRKAHYRVHKSHPLGPILLQVNLVRTTPSCLSNIHPPTSIFLAGSFLLFFPRIGRHNTIIVTLLAVDDGVGQVFIYIGIQVLTAVLMMGSLSWQEPTN